MIRAKDALVATGWINGMYLFIWATSLLCGNIHLPNSHYWEILLTVNAIGLAMALILRIVEVNKK